MGLAVLLGCIASPGTLPGDEPRRVELPEPRPTGMMLTEALRGRRSVRTYRREPPGLEEISQVLWAAQGITDRDRGFRTAPSAGATFPIEIYLVVGEEGQEPPLSAGVFRYLPEEHALERLRSGDHRRNLYRAALRQDSIRTAPVVVAITGVTERTSSRYGPRTDRYIAMEAGHVSQNIYLKATAIGLGTVAIGAFDDAAVARVLNLSAGENPMYLMPLGRR